MTTMSGADPDLLDDLARDMTGAAQQLRAVHARLGARVRQAPWAGRDADQLRAEWEGRHGRTVTVAASALESAAAVIIGNAADQRQASAAAGGAIALGASAGAAMPGTVPDRRDAEWEARQDRRGRGGKHDSSPAETPGVGAPSSPLGEPVAGESVPAPEPPAWQPPDPGAGPYASKSPGLDDRASEFAAETGANAMAGAWPDASRNLLHFLGNSGAPLEQDVNKLLRDVPEFAEQVSADRDALGRQAVADAHTRGATGPITYPINTAWNGFGYDQSGALAYGNRNWFYALGGWSYNQTGQVTVYPPAAAGEPWRYESSTSVNLRDRYNWDGGKKVEIGGVTVTDEQLAELHRTGLAREYTAYGRSSQRTAAGIVP